MPLTLLPAPSGFKKLSTSLLTRCTRANLSGPTVKELHMWNSKLDIKKWLLQWNFDAFLVLSSFSQYRKWQVSTENACYKRTISTCYVKVRKSQMPKFNACGFRRHIISEEAFWVLLSLFLYQVFINDEVYLVKLMCMETDTFIHLLWVLNIDRSFHKRLREHGN